MSCASSELTVLENLTILSTLTPAPPPVTLAMMDTSTRHLYTCTVNTNRFPCGFTSHLSTAEAVLRLVSSSTVLQRERRESEVILALSPSSEMASGVLQKPATTALKEDTRLYLYRAWRSSGTRTWDIGGVNQIILG